MDPIAWLEEKVYVFANWPKRIGRRSATSPCYGHCSSNALSTPQAARVLP